MCKESISVPAIPLTLYVAILVPFLYLLSQEAEDQWYSATTATCNDSLALPVALTNAMLTKLSVVSF